MIRIIFIPPAGREASALAGPQHLLTGVGAQHDLTLEHVDELLLVGMPVPHGRLLARRQGGQVHPALLQAEGAAQLALLARQDARAVGLGIAGVGAGLEAGHVVLTGSMTRVVPVKRGGALVRIATGGAQ